MRSDCTTSVFSTKLRIIVHNFVHQLFDQLLADRSILLARKFCDRLRDRVDHLVRLTGIYLLRAAGRRGILGKKIGTFFARAPPACPGCPGGRCRTKTERRATILLPNWVAEHDTKRDLVRNTGGQLAERCKQSGPPRREMLASQSRRSPRYSGLREGYIATKISRRTLQRPAFAVGFGNNHATGTITSPFSTASTLCRSRADDTVSPSSEKNRRTLTPPAPRRCACRRLRARVARGGSDCRSKHYYGSGGS